MITSAFPDGVFMGINQTESRETTNLPFLCVVVWKGPSGYFSTSYPCLVIPLHVLSYHDQPTSLYVQLMMFAMMFAIYEKYD